MARGKSTGKSLSPRSGGGLKKTKSQYNDDLILARSMDVITRKNADGTCSFIHLRNDKWLYSLDGIAAEFWLMIDGKSTLAKIKQKLMEKHNPPATQLQRDISTLIGKLVQEDLLSI